MFTRALFLCAVLTASLAAASVPAPGGNGTGASCIVDFDSNRPLVAKKFKLAVSQCVRAAKAQASGRALYRTLRSAFRKWGNAFATEVASTQITCESFGTSFECVPATYVANELSSAEAAAQAAFLLTQFETLAGCQPVDASSPFSTANLSRALGDLVTRVTTQVTASVCVGPGSTASATGFVDCYSKFLGRSVANLVANALISRGCIRGSRGNELRVAVLSSAQPICACTGWVETMVNGTQSTAQVTISASCDPGADGSLPSDSACGTVTSQASQTAVQELALELTADSVLNACGYSDTAAALYNSTKVTLEAWGTELANATISAQATCAPPSTGARSMQCLSASTAIQSVVETQASVLAVGLATAMNDCPACGALSSVDTTAVAMSFVDSVTAAIAQLNAKVCVGPGSTALVDGYAKCLAKTVARGFAQVVLDTMVQGGCFSADQSYTGVAQADVSIVAESETIPYCACSGWQAIAVNGVQFIAQSNATSVCLT